MKSALIVALAILTALPFGSSLPDDAAKWLLNADPLSVRRLDVDLDGDDDRVVIVQNKDGQIEAVTLCSYPNRWWQPWERCGYMGVGGRGIQGGRSKVERVQTGDFDGDGRVDLLVEVKTPDGLHNLALGPLIKPNAFMVAPELHLRAQAFSVWDVVADNRVEIVALKPEGVGNGPTYVTYVREIAG